MTEEELILVKLKIVSEEKENGAYISDKKHSKILLNYIKQKDKEIERLNNIINELEKYLEEIKDRVIKTNWWLENMLKQAKNMETRAIISGTLELLLGSDKE